MSFRVHLRFTSERGNTMTRELSLGVAGLSKVYRNFLRKETEALQNIDIEVPRGEFVSIIGPSGCGKSTSLRACRLSRQPAPRYGSRFNARPIRFETAVE